jgi:hypothetical protein
MGLGLGISLIISQSITLLPGRLMVKALPLSRTFKVRTRYTSNPSCKLMLLKSGFFDKFGLLTDYEGIIIAE